MEPAHHDHNLVMVIKQVGHMKIFTRVEHKLVTRFYFLQQSLKQNNGLVLLKTGNAGF